MLVAESLKALLFPFEWNHVYVPIVPTSYLHLIEAPVTYLMGLSANISAEDQADICVLDIDNNKLTLPEDIPNLPNRDELVDAINALLTKPSVSQPNDPFSLLKLNSVSPPESPKPSPSAPPSSAPSFAERRLSRPPKLKLVRQYKSDCKDTPGPEEQSSQQIFHSNFAIRTLILEHLSRMFQNYEKFVIFPPDRDTWDNDRENLQSDNFERDVFLCDQAQQNLTFLSRFLETHIFSHFIDTKILTTFDSVSAAVSMFDKTIKEIKISEIKSPITSEVRRTRAESCTSLLEIVCRPPIERGKVQVTRSGNFPALRANLLTDDGFDKTAVSMSRKLLRQRSIKEAKAKLEHNNSTSSIPPVNKVMALSPNDSFEKMMKAHADFTTQLLKVGN